MWSIKTFDLSWLLKTFQSPCTIVVKRVKSLVRGNPSYQTYSHRLRTPQWSSPRLHQQSLRVLPKPPGPEVALVSLALSTTFYISLSHASQSYQSLHLKCLKTSWDFKLLMEFATFVAESRLDPKAGSPEARVWTRPSPLKETQIVSFACSGVEIGDTSAD